MKNITHIFAVLIVMLAVCLTAVCPATADVFGSNMFTGKFAAETFTGFNPNYLIAIGDNITLKAWGAVTFDGILSVDPQGNIFVPEVGPVPM